MRWKTDRAAQTWVSLKEPKSNSRKPFIVGGKAVDELKNSFDFTKAKSTMQFGANSLDTDKSAKSLFTAETRTWSSGQEESSKVLRTALKW
jgi:hypothetical protein